jgi:hypothetical protein
LLLCWKPNDVAEVMTLPKKKRKKGLVMRKLFLMLAVLLVASTAYAADVTVSCAQVADTNEVIVSYVASAEANIPRAFALDIQLDNDETILSVTPLDPNYWLYPGTYPGGEPIGDPCDSSDTLPGIDTNGVTIEMASLHSPPEVSSPNAPDQLNDLLRIFVSGTCNMSISGNAARGKVVLYDATNEDDGRDVVYTGCTITIPPPGCATCPGDLNGDSIKKLVDMYMLRGKLITAYNTTGLYEVCKDDPTVGYLWDICGDMNADNCLKLVDMYMLRGQLITCYNSSGLYECPCP